MNNNSKYKPPHLPQDLQIPTKVHSRLSFFLVLFAVLLLSGLAGVASSLSVIAWLAPPVVLDQVLFVDNLSKNSQTISPTMIQQTKQRIVSVYDSREMVGREFYREDAFVASSIMVSSDGWGAIYKPDYILGEEVFWEAIDYQGESHGIKNSIFDSKTGILYLNYNGSGFRVVSFMDSDDLDHTKYAVLYNRDGSKNILLGGKFKIFENKDFSVWDPQYRFLKDSEFSVGSVLFTNDGDFLGFIGMFGLVESWQVEDQLLSLLSEERLHTEYLDISGFIIEEVFDTGKWSKIDGFYISSLNSSYNNYFKVGDLIIKINNNSINKFNLAKQILQGGDEFSVKIIRKGEELEVFVK